MLTCWHVELSILGLLHLSISIHLRNSFSCSMKFFLGLALGESWPLLAQPQKNTDVYKGMLPWEGFPRQTCINHLRRKQGCKLSLVRNKDAVRYRLNLDCCMTILLRQPWEEFLPWEWTPWHWPKHLKFRPSWLFHKGCLSLYSCQTAILPHVGTLNSACWAFSTCQSVFIWAIALIASAKTRM